MPDKVKEFQCVKCYSESVTADSEKGIKIGHDQSESSVTFVWNGWSRSIGMSGHDGAEYASRRGAYEGCKYQYSAVISGCFNNEEGKVYIQISPLDKSRTNKQNFIRVDFNPSKLTKLEIIRVSKILRYLAGIGKKKSLLMKMKITRVDFAIDILGLHIADILVRACGFRNQKIITNKETGALETIMIGIARKIYRIYDRYAKKHSEAEFKVSDRYDMTRIEVQVRPYCKYNEITQKIKGPFDKLRFYSNDLEPNDFKDEFMDELEEYGFQASCVGMSDLTKEILSHYEISLFDKEEADKKALRLLQEFLRLFRRDQL